MRAIVNEVLAAGSEQEAVEQGASVLLRVGAPPFVAAGPVARAVAGFVREDPELVGLMRVDGAASALAQGGLCRLDVRPEIALTPVSVLYREQHGVAGEVLARLVAELERVSEAGRRSSASGGPHPVRRAARAA